MEASSTSKSTEMIIRVMPKEFLGREASMAEKPKVPLPPPAPLPIVPKPPILPATISAQKKTKMPLILLGFGIIILVGLGVGGYYYWQSMQQPIIVETPVVEPPVVVPPPVVEPPVVIEAPVVPQPGIDTDSDGLTDTEEALYGTDHRNPDTDADTFLDGNEVFHSYDPLGYAPETLLDTGRVAVFEPSDVAFSVYYPKAWRTVITTSGVTFRTAGLSEITVNVEMMKEGETLRTWYARVIAPGNGAKDLQDGVTKFGYASLMSNDELAAYVLEGDGKVYAFKYDLKEESSIEYLNTFQMMVNSLKMTSL